jgi:hypothetical protein
MERWKGERTLHFFFFFFLFFVLKKMLGFEKKNKFLIRVKEMNQFLLAQYGAPTWVGHRIQSGESYAHPAAIQGKAGVIRYSDCNFKTATGHIDIWDGYRCKGSNQIQKCKKVEVWNICNPKAHPNYSALWAHMKKTKAWDPRTRPMVNGSPVLSIAGSKESDLDEIRKAQVFLNTLAVRLKNKQLEVGKVDGIIGKNTRRGVMEFQKMANLKPDGVLGKKTLNAMLNYK